jgi:hypothetical protein
MANDVNQNPMVIDSTGLVLNAMGENKVYVKEIQWLAPAGTLVMTINGSPAITFNANAAGDDQLLNHNPWGWCEINITTKGGGNVLIFHDI